MSRYDHPLLRTGICASATLLLPHPLPSSFIQHKQFQPCKKRVHVAEHIRGFPGFLLPEVCPQGVSSGIIRLRSVCTLLRLFLVFTLKPTF